MLTTRLIHPEILAGLAAAGHGSKILIADGNYPVATASTPSAKRVYLNLQPGQLLVDDILDVVADAVPIESAEVMAPDDGAEPDIFGSFRRRLGVPLHKLDRHQFYESAKEDSLALVIGSGDVRHFANIILTIGVFSA